MLHSELRELQKDYNGIYATQRNINKQWHGKSLKYKGGLDDLDGGLDFKFDNVFIPEDEVQITYTYVESDGELVLCVDWLKVEQFIRCFEIE
jgi:hypothetical protein